MAKAPAKPAAPTAAVPPFIVLAGEELFLRNQHLADIRHALFGAEDPGMGLVRLDAASLSTDAVAAILDEVRTPSMFAPRKLVIVDPADPLFKKGEDAGGGGGAGGGGDAADEEDSNRIPNRELLENYAAAPVDTATLVLVFTSWKKSTRLHKLLEKTNAVRWCESVKPGQVNGWLVRRAKEAYGKTIDLPAASRLAELIGPDLQRLDNELAKLSLYDPAAPAISLQAINALVGFQHEQEIWDMINALAARDAATALKKIDEIWAPGSKIEYTVTGAMFVWLNQVLRARELIDRRLPDGAIASQLKLWPPDRAPKVLALARSWGIQGAARFSEAMLHMDLANKSSLGEPRLNLEKFVVQLCTS